jgi:hypothetical protein
MVAIATIAVAIPFAVLDVLRSNASGAAPAKATGGRPARDGTSASRPPR